MKEYSIMLAFSAGLLGVLQGTINSSIGKAQGQYVMIIGVSLIQIIVAAMLLRTGGPFSFSFAGVFSPRVLVSGALGVCIMFGVSKATGTIGALPVLVTLIAGQIVASAIMDHWGLMGLSRSPFTLQKLGSILVIAAGIYWLTKSQSSS